jgi:hypothetical protein
MPGLSQLLLLSVLLLSPQLKLCQLLLLQHQLVLAQCFSLPWVLLLLLQLLWPPGGLSRSLRGQRWQRGVFVCLQAAVRPLLLLLQQWWWCVAAWLGQVQHPAAPAVCLLQRLRKTAGCARMLRCQLSCSRPFQAALLLLLLCCWRRLWRAGRLTRCIQHRRLLPQRLGCCDVRHLLCC